MYVLCIMYHVLQKYYSYYSFSRMFSQKFYYDLINYIVEVGEMSRVNRKEIFFEAYYKLGWFQGDQES